MFRDRTNLFIAYRRTFPHHGGPFSDNTGGSTFDRLSEEEEGLIGQSPYKDDENETIEMSQLPPNMMKLQQESEAMLNGLVQDINDLGKLYRNNMLPGFNDKSEDEAKINKVSMKITKKFQFLYTEIRKLDDERLQFQRKSETALVENLKKKLAIRTQELSTSFRKLQNNYIKYLRQDEVDMDSTNMQRDDAFNESQIFSNNGKGSEEDNDSIESYSRAAMQSSSKQLIQQQQQQQGQLDDQYLQEREREIYKIAQGVVEISTIFKELENMVIDQGTMLDRIDYNLSKTVIDVKKADKQMKKAEKYQKASTKCKVVFFLVLVILLLLLVLMLKPRSVNHYIHDGGDDGNTSKHPDSPGNGNSDTTSEIVDVDDVVDPGNMEDTGMRKIPPDDTVDSPMLILI